jgi:hypothetical protein
MFDNIYDATLIHVPDEEDVEMDGDLACPDCGELMFPDLTDEVLIRSFVISFVTRPHISAPEPLKTVF